MKYLLWINHSDDGTAVPGARVKFRGLSIGSSHVQCDSDNDALDRDTRGGPYSSSILETDSVKLLSFPAGGAAVWLQWMTLIGINLHLPLTARTCCTTCASLYPLIPSSANPFFTQSRSLPSLSVLHSTLEVHAYFIVSICSILRRPQLVDLPCVTHHELVCSPRPLQLDTISWLRGHPPMHQIVRVCDRCTPQPPLRVLIASVFSSTLAHTSMLQVSERSIDPCLLPSLSLSLTLSALL